MEEIVTKAGNDHIATECINTHLLKTRILISKLLYVCGSLHPDGENGSEAKDQVHVRPRQHRSNSVRSAMRLCFDRRERQDREER